MELSIIIVNYNSKLLLEQCIDSIRKATGQINTEVIVVDNNSTDGSKEYLQEKDTELRFIFNKKNTGFAKACNQGFKNSSGKYILFLNPDTILTETCLADCISFFETHPDAGAVGVRMLDGKGRFLKESKRGWPSPSTSFYKLFGPASIFPTSKTFAKYYQGHLAEKENNPVDVLSGAFMMIKRDVIEKVNGFDEDFFMYGEDMDLSIRITRSGYKNYYLGAISVTHLKGGSTVYGNKHIEDFYDAMNVFIKKHYGDRPGGQILFLKAGIAIRKLFAKAGLIFR
jgi:GT2 family glycosyltransferase